MIIHLAPSERELDPSELLLAAVIRQAVRDLTPVRVRRVPKHAARERERAEAAEFLHWVGYFAAAEKRGNFFV